MSKPSQNNWVTIAADGRTHVLNLNNIACAQLERDDLGNRTRLLVYWVGGGSDAFKGEAMNQLVDVLVLSSPSVAASRVALADRPDRGSALGSTGEDQAMLSREAFLEARTAEDVLPGGYEAVKVNPALRLARVTREIPPGLDGTPSDVGRAILLESDGAGGWVDGTRTIDVVNDFDFSRPLPVGLRIKVARVVHQWWLVGAEWPDEAPSVAAPLDRLLAGAGAVLVHGLGRNRPFLLFADGAVDLADVQAVKEAGDVVVVTLKGPTAREMRFRRLPGAVLRLAAGRKADERPAPRDGTPSQEEASCRAR